MKYIKYLAVLFLLLMVSCTDDLNQFPQDQISTPTFWKTENDANLALNGCYSASAIIAYHYWYFDGASDNTVCQYNWESSATDIALGNVTPAIDGIYVDWTKKGIQGSYLRLYELNRRCNSFFENIENVTMDAGKKAAYKAEVAFWRAFAYFLLAEMYGDVPLITSTKTEEVKLTPVKETDVVAFALKDLDSAIPNLPEKPENPAKISKGAALALKARIQAYYGKWAEAAATAKQAMDLNKYSLYKVAAVGVEDYKDDYSKFVTFANDAAKENFYKGLRSYQKMFYKSEEGTNPEMILVTQYVASNQYQYNETRTNGINSLGLPSELNGWSSITPTQSLIDAYQRLDGSKPATIDAAVRATNYNYPNEPKPAYFDEFKNRDPRLYATVFFTGNMWNEYAPGYAYKWGKGGVNNSPTGYNLRKMVDPAYSKSPEFVGGQSFPLLRYAEVLLTYAEAKNEANGPDATVFDALDQIRTRAGMPKVDRTMGQAALREFIHNERRVELAAEGQRYFDIRRWNIAANVMTPVKDPTNGLAQNRVWKQNFVKLAYPQTAVDRNPELKAAQATKGY